MLVIDDSNTIRKSAEMFLSQAGFDVCLAEDGFSGLSMVMKTSPDFIFIDVSMPKLDGYQACELIKKNPECKDVPVIMLTSKDTLFDRARGKLAGADQYLIKPFTKEGLVEAIRCTLDRAALASHSDGNASASLNQG